MATIYPTTIDRCQTFCYIFDMAKDHRHVAIRLPTFAHADFVRKAAKKDGLSLTQWLLWRIFTVTEDRELSWEAAKAARKAKNV